MRQIGSNFLTNRERGRSTAFRQLERDIMANFSILVPTSLSFDNLVHTVMEIEKFLKDNPDATGDSDPMKLFSEFLQGGEDTDDIRII